MDTRGGTQQLRLGGPDLKSRGHKPVDMSSDLKRRELTQRQREVLSGVRRGLANKEIAHELGVGTDDVKRIVSRLLAWFDAPNRTALAQAAAPGHPVG